MFMYRNEWDGSLANCLLVRMSSSDSKAFFWTMEKMKICIAIAVFLHVDFCDVGKNAVTVAQEGTSWISKYRKTQRNIIFSTMKNLQISVNDAT